MALTLSLVNEPGTDLYTLSLHDALPIWWARASMKSSPAARAMTGLSAAAAMTSTGSILAMARTSSPRTARPTAPRSEEHTSELQSPDHLVCRLVLEKKNEQLRIVGRLLR